jgi:hypothetical protein
MSGNFAPGDTVQVISTHPPGHRRTPYYIRGKTGEIERVCGDFANPEELATDLMDCPKRLCTGFVLNKRMFGLIMLDRNRTQ